MLRQRDCLLTDRCEPARSPAAQSPDYLLRKIWTVPIHLPLLRLVHAPLALLVLLLAPILALLDPLHAPNNSAQSLRRRLRAPKYIARAVALERDLCYCILRAGGSNARLYLCFCAR